MPEEFLTVDEFAASMKVSRWTVGRLIKSGELKAVKGEGRNGSVRIPVTSHADYIERHTVNTTEEKG